MVCVCLWRVCYCAWIGGIHVRCSVYFVLVGVLVGPCPHVRGFFFMV